MIAEERDFEQQALGPDQKKKENGQIFSFVNLQFISSSADEIETPTSSSKSQHIRTELNSHH
jgi:hypothetical protein